MKIAHWAYFDADPESKPPFNIRIGITNDGTLDELVCEHCQSIPDGAERVMQTLTSSNLARSKRFYFIYPRFAVSDELESTCIQIAWLVKNEADRLGVGFQRNILALELGDLVEPVLNES
jgi:hypothetical protein